MAGTKELIELIAREFGAPLETVAVYDRFLAEAGMRTRAKRGRGFTPMTYQDAANLVIAVAIQAPPKDVVRTVQRYSTLKPDDNRLGNTFGDALASLLETTFTERDRFSAPYEHPIYQAYYVSLYGPIPGARVQVNANRETSWFRYGEHIAEAHDLHRSVTFSQASIGPIAEAIAADLPNNPPKPA